MVFIIGQKASYYESPECEVLRVESRNMILSGSAKGSIEDWGEEDLFENE